MIIAVGLMCFTQNIWPCLDHKTSHKSLGYICRNSQKYTVWVKMIDFPFMPKIIRMLRLCSMKIFWQISNINISKLNFWLYALLKTLKVIFSIFWRIISINYCPILTNYTSIESVFIHIILTWITFLHNLVLRFVCLFVFYKHKCINKLLEYLMYLLI